MELVLIIKKQLSNLTIRNILIVGIVTLFLKGIGFFKEAFIASSFGISELLDTYYIAMLVPTFIHEIFAGSFKNVFIPNYINELRVNKSASSFQTVCFILTGSVALLFITLTILFANVYLEIFFKGHTPTYYHLIKIQLYYILPCIVFWGFSSLLSGLLNINDEFTFSSVYLVFTPVSVVLCLYFFKEELAGKVLAVGTLVGSFLQFMFLVVVSLKRNIIKLSRPNFKNRNIRELFRQMPPKVLSSFLAGMNNFVDQFFAAQLVVGSIAALNYGRKIPVFIFSILVMALGNVLLPYFSKLVVDNKELAFKKLYFSLKWLFLCSSCFVLICIFFSHSIVEILFQRNAFTAEDTLLVAAIQKIFLVYIPFYVCSRILVKFLTSINKNAFMAWASLVKLTLHIILNYYLMMEFGIMGIALSTSIVSLVHFFILIKYTNRQERKMLSVPI